MLLWSEPVGMLSSTVPLVNTSKANFVLTLRTTIASQETDLTRNETDTYHYGEGETRRS